MIPPRAKRVFGVFLALAVVFIYTLDSTKNLRIASFLTAIAALIVVIVLGRTQWTRNSQDGPLLSSAAMLGEGALQSMAKGDLVGYHYNLLTNEVGRVMMLVDLGHNSLSHLIAYGDKSDLDVITIGSLNNKWLEPASLEGDFPNYFHMYCNPEAQATLREVFAPDVMAQFVDFCRAYDFELYHDTLYLSRAQGARDEKDTTTLVTDITDFLEQNKSVIGRL